MALVPYVSPDRVVITGCMTKDVLLNRLIESICNQFPTLKKREMLTKVLEREDVVSTRIGPGIAVPHAIVDSLSDSIIAIGICHDGIQWDWEKESAVYLILLLVGNRSNHLALLSEIAGHVRERDNYERLLDCRSGREVYDFIEQLDRGGVGTVSTKDHDISRSVFRNAWDIAREIGNAKVVLHADAIVNKDYILRLVGDTTTIIVTSTPSKFVSNKNDRFSVFEIPTTGIRKPSPIQFTLLFLLTKGVIGAEDMVIHVYGTPDSGFVDSIRLSFVNTELNVPFSVSDNGMISVTGAHVLTRVLQIASELAREGREGKPVGAIFIVGDYEQVKQYTHQLIINPFRGYKEEERNIFDPSLEETIKEYAKIDGAFIIREDGVIVSSGTFISGRPSTESMQSGLGARHAAGLGISAATSSFAVVVSESTRKITVFHTGKTVVVL